MKGFIFAIAIGGLVSTTASAITSVIPSNLDIDFRDAPWTSDADNLTTFTVGDVTATALERSTLNDDLSFSIVGEGTLFAADPLDGLGIRETSNEADEIARFEVLSISFASSQSLSGVWITDLFAFDNQANGDGSDPINGEVGYATIQYVDGFETLTFFGVDSAQDNGELFLDLDSYRQISQIDFFTTDIYNDDFLWLALMCLSPVLLRYSVLV